MEDRQSEGRINASAIRNSGAFSIWKSCFLFSKLREIGRFPGKRRIRQRLRQFKALTAELDCFWGTKGRRSSENVVKRQNIPFVKNSLTPVSNTIIKRKQKKERSHMLEHSFWFDIIPYVCDIIYFLSLSVLWDRRFEDERSSARGKIQKEREPQLG